MDQILILGGAGVHSKLVLTAKKMGIRTTVVDYLSEEESPAKQLSDSHYMIDVKDVTSIVKLCKKKNIHAVLSTHLDPCQIPYVKACDELGVPCLWNKEQVDIFTNKHLFKQECIRNGLYVTEEFSDSLEKIEYPVFVKPVDSRGSRGQLKANNLTELMRSIEIAKHEAISGKYIIEKYYNKLPEVQVTYFFENGEGVLIRTADSYRGEHELHNVISNGESPSKYNDLIIQQYNSDIIAFLKCLNIKNGPVMMQGFLDDGKYRLFDQGLRFPGVDYEICFYKEFGINLIEPLIEFSFSGKMPNVNISDEMTKINGKCFRILFPLLKTGKIVSISGIDKVKKIKEVSSVLMRKKNGDIVENNNSIDRRLAEIDIIGNDRAHAINIEKMILSLIEVYDENGNDMLIRN